MNVDELMNNLEYAIKKATETLQLPTKTSEFVAPAVNRGYLPTKNPKNTQNNDIPCVIIRFLSDETSEDEITTTAKVKVICIVYSQDDEHGWRELLTIMNPIRTYLLAHRNIGECYRMVLPLKRNIPEEQAPPEWAGEFILNIEIPTVQEVDSNVNRFLAGQDN